MEKIVKELRTLKMPLLSKSKKKRNNPKLTIRKISKRKTSCRLHIELHLEFLRMKNNLTLRYSDLVFGKMRWRKLLLKTCTKR